MWGWMHFSETEPFIFGEDEALNYRAQIPHGLH